MNEKSRYIPKTLHHTNYVHQKIMWYLGSHFLHVIFILSKMLQNWHLCGFSLGPAVALILPASRVCTKFSRFMHISTPEPSVCSNYGSSKVHFGACGSWKYSAISNFVISHRDQVSCLINTSPHRYTDMHVLVMVIIRKCRKVKSSTDVESTK